MKNVTALEIMAKTISKLASTFKHYDIMPSIYKYAINSQLLSNK